MAYHLLHGFLKAISYVPLNVLYSLSGVLYFLAYYVVAYRRKVVRKNLTESFPEKSEKEIGKLEKNFYRYFTDNIIETCKMGGMSAKEISRRMKFVNIDALNTRLREGHSIALYLGHYANWEWISSMPLHLDQNAVCAQIYHQLSNKNFDKIMLENRSVHGAVNVEMRQTARFVNDLARNNRVAIIGFIADQAPREKDIHYYLPFLHHRTPVLIGTEKITKHYSFDAWYVRPKRIKRGYYEVEFIHMHDNPDSLPDFELTDIYYKLLEETIRNCPELYLWTHKRFRSATLIEQ